MRRANSEDADAILEAHLDSIRSLGPGFYSPDTVEAWSAGLSAQMYAGAMANGEVFFVAAGTIDGEPVVLGFSSHRVDDGQHGVSVYVRGRASRRGIGTRLLRLAEDHAREAGATTIDIQASLPGVAFYRANGFEELGHADAMLSTGQSIPCVWMQKRI